MDVIRDNFKNENSFMNPYFRDELLKQPPVEEKVRYGKVNVQIGRRTDGSIFTMDMGDAIRCVMVGSAGCVPYDTKVQTKDGLKKIGECHNSKVLSFNFEKGIIEEKDSILHPAGKKKIVRIKTSAGEIICSPKHRFYVKRNGKTIIMKANEILKTDKFLKVVVLIEEIDVLDIEITEEEIDMTDMEVEGNNNFILENGIVVKNSGKTFFLRSIMSRMSQVGFAILQLSDIKNEIFCISTEQKVITNNGMKKIKELDEEKDKVLTRNFKEEKDEYKSFEKSGTKKDDIYEVEFDDGTKVYMTENHKMFDENMNEVKLKDAKQGQQVTSL